MRTQIAYYLVVREAGPVNNLEINIMWIMASSTPAGTCTPTTHEQLSAGSIRAVLGLYFCTTRLEFSVVSEVWKHE